MPKTLVSIELRDLGYAFDLVSLAAGFRDHPGGSIRVSDPAAKIPD